MATSHRLSFIRASAALVLATAGGFPFAANAQSHEDIIRLVDALKKVEARAGALEARVAALEGENRHMKKEAAAARAEAEALRHKMGGTPSTLVMAAAPTSPRDATGPSMVTKAPPPAPGPRWTGLYAGVAFGAASMRGATNESSTDLLTEAVPASAPNLHTALITTTNTSLGARDVGAAGNLALGYNFMVAPTVVLGGQIEGGVSNVRVNLTGGGASNASGTVAFLPLVPGIGLTPLTSTETFSATDSLDNRWMVSALARGGLLVDTQDLIYGLGGYTYGRFEAFGLAFGLNGATVGAGWERQVAAGWTLRGEYRYTKFQSKDVSQSSQSALVQNIPGIGPVLTNDTFSRTDHVSADMQSVWLGVAHYFDQ